MKEKEYVARLRTDIIEFLETSLVWGHKGDKELKDRAYQVFAAFMLKYPEISRKWLVSSINKQKEKVW